MVDEGDTMMDAPYDTLLSEIIAPLKVVIFFDRLFYRLDVISIFIYLIDNSVYMEILHIISCIFSLLYTDTDTKQRRALTSCRLPQ